MSYKSQLFKNNIESFNDYLIKSKKSISNLPIFLDSNILLYYYLEMEEEHKDIFVKYIKENKENLYITNDTQNDFIYKLINIVKINTDINLDENFIQLINSLNKTEKINYDDLIKIHKEYKLLSSKEYTSFINFPEYFESTNHKINLADFTIYHELISFMKKNDTSIIFLTIDNDTKIRSYKNKYTELEYNSFKNTNNILYITPYFHYSIQMTISQVQFKNMFNDFLDSSNNSSNDSDEELGKFI